MNTTVITVEETDFGVGTSDRVTFVDCSWHIDEHGTLHIVREGRKGNCGAFAHGSWRAVVEGEMFNVESRPRRLCDPENGPGGGDVE
jgi:hypothetical protein